MRWRAVETTPHQKLAMQVRFERAEGESFVWEREDQLHSSDSVAVTGLLVVVFHLVWFGPGSVWNRFTNQA